MHPWGSPLKLGYIYSPFVGRSVPVPTLRAGCPQDPIQNASNAPATKSTPTGVLENPKCSKWETSLQIFHLNHINSLCVCVCVCVCVCYSPSPVWLSATLWTIAHQAPLSMGFPRQEYWSGLPFPPPGDLPHPGIESVALTSPALAGEIFTTSATSEAHINNR